MPFISISNPQSDDTQLFNKDERSVEKSFDILSKYEKASGSRINYILFQQYIHIEAINEE
jgi:hypothetical protein